MACFHASLLPCPVYYLPLPPLPCVRLIGMRMRVQFPRDTFRVLHHCLMISSFGAACTLAWATLATFSRRSVLKMVHGSSGPFSAQQANPTGR